MAIKEILKKNTDTSNNFVHIVSEMNFSWNFTLGNSITCYISIKILPSFFVFVFLISWTKECLKSWHIAVISLKTDSPLNFTLKYMYNMSYIQTLIFGKNAHLMDSGSPKLYSKCMIKQGAEQRLSSKFKK